MNAIKEWLIYKLGGNTETTVDDFLEKMLKERFSKNKMIHIYDTDYGPLNVSVKFTGSRKTINWLKKHYER